MWGTHSCPEAASQPARPQLHLLTHRYHSRPRSLLQLIVIYPLQQTENASDSPLSLCDTDEFLVFLSCHMLIVQNYTHSGLSARKFAGDVADVLFLAY